MSRSWTRPVGTMFRRRRTGGRPRGAATGRSRVYRGRMSDVPFGFGLPDRDPERREPERQEPGSTPDPTDPFGLGALFGGVAGGGSPEDVLGKMPLFAELQKLMSWSGGPVNWDLARQSAISQLAAGHQPTSEAERAAAAEALRLADLWLDQVTDLPSGIERTAAWSRVDWVEQTLPAWGSLIDPLAERVVAAMTSALPQEAAMSFGPIAGIMGRMGGLMFGAQVGSAMGKLADEVLTSTDVALPLAPAGTGVLVPQNVAEFAAGLDRPADEVRLFLALREAASQRLFAHVPWLRQQLQDAVHAYARGITIDREAIERGLNEAMSGMEGGIDPSNPESIQQLLGSGLLEPEETPEQQMALRRLETLLALVEGWIDTVVAEAAKDRLPGHSALAETMRRRRGAAGGRGAGGRSRRSRPWSAWSCDRAGCGTRPPSGVPWASSTAAVTVTASGPTPTCCRRRTTSTSRWTSSRARAWTTSSRH